MGRLFILVVTLTALLPTRRAQACATCSVGDPTLTTLGQGQPSRGRLRAGLLLRHHRESFRDEGLTTHLRQERYELGVAWALTERWMLGLTVPAAYQRVRHPNLAESRRWSMGDVGLSTRMVLYRDRRLGARHLLIGAIGLELPTASRPNDIPDELHAGSGTWDPSAGIDYLFFARPWSLSLGARVIAPLSERGDTRPAPGFQGALSVQLQPHAIIGARLSSQLRHEGGDTGGSLVRLGGGFVLSPATDLVLSAQVSFVAWQTGPIREGVVFELGGTLDF